MRVSVARVDRTAVAPPIIDAGEAEAGAPSSAPPTAATSTETAAASSAPSSAPVAVAANTASAPAEATAAAPEVPAAPPGVASSGVATVAANATPAPVAPDIEPETNAGGVSPQVAQQESEQDARAVAQDKPLVASQPVSAKEAEEITPGLGPTSVVTADNADATDYSVGADDTIVVAPTETLGAYAGWLNINPTRLRALNHVRGKGGVRIGRKLKLDFAHSTHEQFEALRRDYHRQLQAAYFASHRISGTQVHVVRTGDSLWSLAHRFGDLPQWLMQQYNPDVAFDALRAGTQIVLPRVEDLGNPDADK